MLEENSLITIFSGTDLEAVLTRDFLVGNGIHAFLEDERLGRVAPDLASVNVKVAARDAAEASRRLEARRGDT